MARCVHLACNPFLSSRSTIFERCKLERRILVTTSTKSLQRKDCPPGTYLLDTKSLKNLEVTLVHLLLSHGVILEPKKFLSRCVVCNGSIERVHDEQQIQNIFATYAAPESLNEEILEVFQCSGCSQGYWWCDRPTSSASRVKSQATILLETCIRGGVPIEKDMAMFFFVDAEKVKQDTTEITEESRLLNQRLDVLEWLQDEKLKSAFGPMLSAYAIGEGDESLPFTNVTADFVGHLDYIMFQEKHLKVKDRLYVPTTFEELNGEDIHNGHLLPSNVWPSDHLAIGARFCYKSTSVGVEVANSSGELQQSSLVTKKESDGENEKRMAVSEVTNSALFCAPIQEGSYAPPLQTVPITHTSSLSCGCGCVPKIPSLFEMAELRKQARLKQKS